MASSEQVSGCVLLRPGAAAKYWPGIINDLCNVLQMYSLGGGVPESNGMRCKIAMGPY